MSIYQQSTMPINRSPIILLLGLCILCAHAKIQGEPSIPLINVTSVIGAEVELPCDIALPFPEDRLLLVLWYKDGLSTPIYSFDARMSLSEGRHWFDTETIRNRLEFHLHGYNGDTNTSYLTLSDVRSSDAGMYRCRADFKMSPTRNARVNLKIYVLPPTPVIFDANGLEAKDNAVGPFNEGGTLVLTCESSGDPLPKVTWWRENRLLDATSESTIKGRVRNTIRLPNLSRSDLGMNLTCLASNSNVSIPTSTTVTVDLKLRPLGLKFEGEYQSFSANQKYELVCSSWGARPPVFISWWKGSTRLQSNKQTVSPDNDMTTSTLTYVPSIDDQDKTLSCRVENLLLSSALQEDLKLKIKYPPIVKLEVTNSIDLDNVKEGNYISLKCNVKAFPRTSRIIWRHNGKRIDSQLYSTQELVIQDESLTLKNIMRRWSGLFTCVASNDEGDTESNTISLNVWFSPVCKSSQNIIQVTKGEMIHVPCELEAYPTDLTFYWTFNGSREITYIPTSNYATDRLKSSLSYRPATDKDYGTLSCWAKNVVGEQRRPCIFQVMPVGKPDPVLNCSITSVYEDTVQINCAPGNSGGLDQKFNMEVVDVTSGSKILDHTGSPDASFYLRDLEIGQDYEITIWASNSMGLSDPTVIQISNFHKIETESDKRIEAFVPSNASNTTLPSESLAFQLTPILGSIIGLGSALILAAIIIALIMRLREKRNKRHRTLTTKSDKALVPFKHSDSDVICDLRQKKPAIREKGTLPQTKITTGSKSKDDIFYSELSSQPNDPVNQSCPDSTQQRGVQQAPANVNSMGSVAISQPAPSPSVYVRLPAIDNSIPYADASSSSSSPSQCTSSTSQMVFLTNDEKEKTPNDTKFAPYSVYNKSATSISSVNTNPTMRRSSSIDVNDAHKLSIPPPPPPFDSIHQTGASNSQFSRLLTPAGRTRL